MPTHIFISDNESPIDHLTNTYGTRLEKLDEKQKLFVAAAIILYLHGLYSLERAIDELDPNAEYPSSFIDLVERLEPTGRQDMLLLIAAIAIQLAWSGKK